MNDNKALVVVRGRRVVAADEDKTRILAAWDASGMGAREFALGVGIAPHLLYGWRRSARRTERVTVPMVEVPRCGAHATWAAEVMTERGTVRFSESASPAWAGELIRELGRC